MKRTVAVSKTLWLTGILFLSCSDSSTPSTTNVQLSDSPLRVIAFGDSGTGTQTQFEVAKAMTSFCASQGCDMGLLLGDNFYVAGVKNVDDKKFVERFEVPYGPMKIPFYVSLGNHDYGFGPLRGNVQAQIDYTQKSDVWKMPARFYSIEKSNVEFFALDTNTYAKEPEQQQWLENKLAQSTAPFKIVFGHHPIYSGGIHGDTGELVNGLLPVLCKAKVSLYLSGHDHHLEALSDPCGINLIVSGASASIRPVGRHSHAQFAKSALGFAYLEIYAAQLTMQLLNKDGQKLFEKSLAPQ